MPITSYTIDQHLQALENQNRVKLTNEAKTLLRIPLLEFYNSPLTRTRQYSTNDNIWKNSLSQLFAELKQNPAYFDEGVFQGSPFPSTRIQVISSISIIKALHSKFCNIPPFCKAT